MAKAPKGEPPGLCERLASGCCKLCGVQKQRRGLKLPTFFHPTTEREAMVMRRPILVLVSSALAMMLLASGVALAKNITGTSRADNIKGTIHADNIRAGDGKDVVHASKGADVIHGDNGVDRLYGGKGNDRIFSAGRVSDVMNCGRGNRDWAKVNPSDKVVGCERVV